MRQALDEIVARNLKLHSIFYAAAVGEVDRISALLRGKRLFALCGKNRQRHDCAGAHERSNVCELNIEIRGQRFFDAPHSGEGGQPDRRSIRKPILCFVLDQFSRSCFVFIDGQQAAHERFLAFERNVNTSLQ